MSTHNQIRIVPNGRWHRCDDNGNDRTACGELIGSAFMSRDAKLDDNLCETCFTRHEVDTGQLNKFESDLQRDSDPALFHDPDDEPTDPNGDPDAIEDAAKKRL